MPRLLLLTAVTVFCVHSAAAEDLAVPEGSAPPDTLSREQLLGSTTWKKLPLRGIGELLALENGVIQLGDYLSNSLSVRGHAQSSNAFLIDRMPMENPHTGALDFVPAHHASQAYSIFRSHAPVSHGGVVGGTTIIHGFSRPSEAPEHLMITGFLEAVTDNLSGSGFDQNWYTGRFQAVLADRADGSLVVERRWFGDRSPSYLTKELPGRPDRLPNNWIDGWSYHGNVNLDLWQNGQLRIRADGSKGEGQEYLHTYYWNTTHTPYIAKTNDLVSARLEGQAQSLAYEFGISRYATTKFVGDGVFRRDLESYRGQQNVGFDDVALYWLPGHVWDEYQKIDTVSKQADTQIRWNGDRVALHVGGVYRSQEFRTYVNSHPIDGVRSVVARGFDENGNLKGQGIDEWEASSFVSGVVGLGTTRLQGGVRVDHLSDASENTQRQPGDGALVFDDGWPKGKTRVTYRLGADAEVLNGFRIEGFVGTSFERETVPLRGFVAELGGRYSTDSWSALATGSWNDVELESSRTSGGTQDSRGFDAEVGYEGDGPLRGSLRYAWSKGQFRPVSAQRDIPWGFERSNPASTAPTDVPHAVTMIGQLALGPGEGLRVGDHRPFERTTISFVYRIQSGRPYTPFLPFNEVTLSSVGSEPSGPLYSARQDSRSSMDLRIDREFRIGGRAVIPFVWVRNLLDTENATCVYSSSGRADATDWLETREGELFADLYQKPVGDTGMIGAELHRLREANPTNVGGPRQVFLGIQLEWGE